MFKSALMEFVGTLFLVFVVAASGNAIAVAITLALMMYIGAHVSGGQYNPALTIALFAAGKIKLNKAIIHIIAQSAGGLAALGIFMLLGGKDFIINPASSATFMQSTLAEMIFSFSLVLTVFYTMVDKKSAGNSYYGFAVGANVLIGALTVGPLSGGAFNPVVGLAPQVYRLLSGNFIMFDVAALYLIAPILGGLLAAQFYEYTSEKGDK